MVYNYNENVGDRESKKVDLSLQMPDSKSYRMTHYRIDENHSNAYTVWKSMGRPFTPDAVQMKELRSRQGLELYEPVKTLKPVKDKITLRLEMPHHSVSLLVFEPVK
jgi:xylan 1,4-beta-xylosidase